jgi:hypothetical protein
VTRDDPGQIPMLMGDTATGTILDDDPRLTINNISVLEGNSGLTTAFFTVSLSAPTERDVTFVYATGNGTAVVFEDFVGTTGTSIIPAGQLSVDVPVSIIGDLFAEPDEYFYLRLLSSTGAAFYQGEGSSYGICTILDDGDVAPPTPTVYIDGAPEVIEGAAGAALTFTINLTSPSLFVIRVDYAVTGGSATPNVDYTPISGTAVFPIGQTSFIISVPVIDDSLSEANETVIVTLSNSVNAVMGNATATGTIIDDDPLPGITIIDASMIEGNIYDSVMVFTVYLSAPSGQPVTITYITIDGTADATDYEPTSGSLTLQPGEMFRTVRVPVYADTRVEDNEHFYVLITAVTGATIDRGLAVGTIIDDDRVARVQVRTDRGVRIVNNRRTPPISFGRNNVGQPGTIHTFTVTNTGTRDLRLGQIIVPRGFKLIQKMRSTLAPSESATFRVQVLTNGAGLRAGHIRFATSDPAAKPFNFRVTAVVQDTPAAQKARAAARKAAAARAVSAQVLPPPTRLIPGLFTAGTKAITADWMG